MIGLLLVTSLLGACRNVELTITMTYLQISQHIYKNYCHTLYNLQPAHANNLAEFSMTKIKIATSASVARVDANSRIPIRHGLDDGMI